MPTLPSKQELKSMMYRDLQKICKDWGVRANLKSDEMIDLLLEAQSRNTLAHTPIPIPQPPVRPKSVSTRRLTSRAGTARLSSVIIHDVLEEGGTTQQNDTSVAGRPNIDASVPSPPTIPTRTKKAKELQKRLGVGKPIAAGGTGARAVTRSTTVPRERLKSNQSIQQLEATIQEEPEPFSDADMQQIAAPSTSQSSQCQIDASQAKAEKTTPVPNFERLLSEVVKPLQDQIETLRAEVKRLQALESEVQTLGVIVKQASSRRTNDEAREWEITFGTRKRSLYSVEPSTPPTTSNVQLPTGTRTLMPSPHITGATSALLGKRQRESPVSESSVAQGEDHQGIPHGTLRSAEKRPKLLGEGMIDKGKEVAREEMGRNGFVNTLPRAASLIVHGRSKSSTNVPENQNPFNFSLLPEPSTPGPTLFSPAFPYPEPPQSPTPAGTNLAGSLSSNNDRLDVFKTFGLPPPDRARRISSGSSLSAVDPAALSHPPGKQRQPSSDESRPGFALTPSTFAGSNPSSEVPSTGVKKTMYGTELEGDTRFGDFGVEGVALGFWTGGRF
ncbi:hypothetical protein D9756_003882 [Leucocoprinus leucothites]|uniref:Uncharacterized protein n=1 Tax=Leucocoprinus leucothites TaxID=201217 RepID=A0A8H5G0Y5_9AGAR|nr:hypothetical protein D9756_003882 [Leucoagaricus leucothites]